MNPLQIYGLGCLVCFFYFEVPYLGKRMDRITEVTARESDPELIRDLGLYYIKHFIRLLFILMSWVWIRMAIGLEVQIVWRMVVERVSYEESFNRHIKR